MKKVLILTWSYWSWHNVAAYTLWDYIKSIWHSVYILDMVDLFNKWTIKTWDGTKYFYEDFCEKYKKIWEITYNIFDDQKFKQFIYMFKYQFLQEKFDKHLKDNDYSVIISVFPFWQIFLKHYLKNNDKTFKTWVFITDSINIHSVWHLNKGIDTFFFIDDESKFEFIKKFGNTKSELITSFFPIHTDFFHNKKEIQVRTIMFLLTWQEKIFAKKLLNKFKNTSYNIYILAWRNHILFKQLKLDFENIQNFHFYEKFNIKENIKNIDIIISKPWGAMIAESIANDIPFIITNFIPWQEEWNKKMIQKYELWFYENDADKVFFNINYINFSKMLPNFQKVKKTNCIQIILENLDLL